MVRTDIGGEVKEFPLGVSVLLYGSVASGKTTFCVTLVRELLRADMPCIWVCIDESPVAIRDKMDYFKLDYGRFQDDNLLRFVDVYSEQISGEALKDPYVINCSSAYNLNEVNRKLMQALSEIRGKGVVVFDSVSSLLLYNKAETAEEFLKVHMSRITSAGFTGFFILQREMQSPRTEEVLKMMCDSVLEFDFQEDKRKISIIKLPLGSDGEWIESSLFAWQLQPGVSVSRPAGPRKYMDSGGYIEEFRDGIVEGLKQGLSNVKLETSDRGRSLGSGDTLSGQDLSQIQEALSRSRAQQTGTAQTSYSGSQDSQSPTVRSPSGAAEKALGGEDTTDPKGAHATSQTPEHKTDTETLPDQKTSSDSGTSGAVEGKTPNASQPSDAKASKASGGSGSSSTDSPGSRISGGAKSGQGGSHSRGSGDEESGKEGKAGSVDHAPGGSAGGHHLSGELSQGPQSGGARSGGDSSRLGSETSAGSHEGGSAQHLGRSDVGGGTPESSSGAGRGRPSSLSAESAPTDQKVAQAAPVNRVEAKLPDDIQFDSKVGVSTSESAVPVPTVQNIEKQIIVTELNAMPDKLADQIRDLLNEQLRLREDMHEKDQVSRESRRRLDSLANRESQARYEVKELDERSRNLRKAIAVKETSIDSLKRERDSQQEKYRAAVKKQEELKKRIDSILARKKSLEDKIHSLVEDGNEMHIDITSYLQKALEKKEQEVAGLNQCLEKLDKDVSVAENEVKIMRGELEERFRERQNKNEELRQVAEKREKLESELELITAARKETESRLDQLKDKKHALEQQLKKAMEEQRNG